MRPTINPPTTPQKLHSPETRRRRAKKLSQLAESLDKQDTQGYTSFVMID
jgi:hypothetical protein